MSNKSPTPSTPKKSGLYSAVAEVIQQARQQVKQAINQHMVQAYWHIGRLIVEEEQQGNERAEYGKQQLKQLSERLQAKFGKGFDVTNLRNMRRFYIAFPIRDAVRLELSWTHFRTLMRIENPKARQWHMEEASSQAWSALSCAQRLIPN